MKQISLTLPENLFNLSKEHSNEYGFRSVQEFIIDLVRNKVIVEKAERYKAIENKKNENFRRCVVLKSRFLGGGLKGR